MIAGFPRLNQVKDEFCRVRYNEFDIVYTA